MASREASVGNLGVGFNRAAQYSPGVTEENHEMYQTRTYHIRARLVTFQKQSTSTKCLNAMLGRSTTKIVRTHSTKFLPL